MSFADNNYSNNRGPRRPPTAVPLENYPDENLTDDIAEQIQQLSSNVAQIEQTARLIGTSKDNEGVRERLRSLLGTTSRLSKKAADNIKVLDSYKGGEKRILQQKLTKDLQIWLAKFQEAYRFASEKDKATPVPAPVKKPQRGGASLEYSNDYREEEKQGLMESNRREQDFKLKSDIEFQNAIIREREEGIKEIEKTVVEVNDIFRDLSALVAEQGSMIDSIESNIETSVVHTSKGVEELQKASTYQKKSRTKLCILLLIIALVVATIIILVWFFVLRKK